MDITQDKLLDDFEKYNKCDQNFRSHLGVSIIGDDCARKIFLSFRFAKKEKFTARQTTIFDLGHFIEKLVIDKLRKIKHFSVFAPNKQYKIVDCFGHLGGSLDGIVVYNNEAYVLEVKSHKNSSYTQFKKHGVIKSHYQHYIQSNIYAVKTGISKILYAALNKDTGEISFEILPVNIKKAKLFIEKAYDIIFNNFSPPLSLDSRYFKCKMCPYYSICFEQEQLKKHCRNCVNSVPLKAIKDGDKNKNDKSVFYIYGDNSIIEPNWICSKHLSTKNSFDCDSLIAEYCNEYLPISF